MKKIITFGLSVILLLSFTNANAKIRRVGFPGTPVTGTDFANFQLANDNSSDGDSIYIFPGSWSGSVNRKIVILGYGCSASALDSGLQHIAGTLSVSIVLNSGCSGTILKGIDGVTLNVNSADTITINRCFATIVFHSSNIAGLSFKNWKITQSIINSFYFYQFNNSYIYASLINLQISNCIIGYITFAGSVSGSASGAFVNNVFAGGNNTVNFNNSSFDCVNNVLLCPNILNSAAADFLYNIASGGIIPSGNGNKPNTDLSTIFVGYPNQTGYSNDNKYTLAAGSPAKKAGENKTDCGIFGGTDPYHLAGIPPIPSFYKLTAPGSASSNPYTITFSIRGNN